MTESQKRKLIEVALPLEAINRESAREKSIRHGHPSTLHLWWARRPLAACRAVLFASLVDDPSAHPERVPHRGGAGAGAAAPVPHHRGAGQVGELDQRAVLRRPGRRSCAPPTATRRPCSTPSAAAARSRWRPSAGPEAHASDLNPVAVLITKALIEIPPKFAGRPP